MLSGIFGVMKFSIALQEDTRIQGGEETVLVKTVLVKTVLVKVRSGATA